MAHDELELRTAQRLADKHLSYRLAESERQNVAAIAGHLEQLRDLRDAFNRGLHPRAEMRNDADLVAIIRGVLQDGAQRTPGERRRDAVLVVRVMARAFRVGALSAPWFAARAESIAAKAAPLKQGPAAPKQYGPAVQPRLTSSLGAVLADALARKPPQHQAAGLAVLPTTTAHPSFEDAPQHQAAGPAVLPVSPVVRTHETAAVTIKPAAAPVPPVELVPAPAENPAGQPLAAGRGVSPAVPAHAAAAADVRSAVVQEGMRTLSQLQANVLRSRASCKLDEAYTDCAVALQQWIETPLDQAALDELRAAIAEVTFEAQSLASGLPDPQLLAALEQERPLLAERLDLEPNAELPQAAFQEFDRVGDWQLLQQAAEAVRDFTAQSVLPAWMWPGVLPHEFRSSPALRAAALLRDPVVLDDLRRCQDWILTRPSADQAVAATLPEPSIGGTLLGRLQTALGARDKRRARVAEAQSRLEALAQFLHPEVHAQLLQQTQRGEDCQKDLVRAESLQQAVASVHACLNQQAYADLLAIVCRLAPESEACLADVGAVREARGDKLLAMLPLPAIRTLAEDEPVRPRKANNQRPQRELSIRFSHPVSLPAPTSATLFWHRADASLPYGLVRIPLRLTIDPPPEQEFEADLSLEGDVFKAMQKDWLPLVSPKRVSFSPPRAPESKRPAVVDIALEIPLSKAQAEKGSLSLTVRLVVAGTNDRFEQSLQWKKLLTVLPPEPAERFPSEVPVREVLDRPLGAEKHFKDLFDLVKSGEQHFVVVGPRRFGKSSLLRALVSKTADFSDVAVLGAVNASNRELTDVWRLVGDELKKRFDRPVKEELEHGLLPAGDAFDRVREEARSRGVRSIYVLIDEAQGLFTHSQRLRLSERLKENLESHWAVRSEKRASIFLGLVGQSHLTKLMSSNLLGALPRLFREDSIPPDDLLPVLREVAQGGLESTAEGRRRLAEESQNIFILNKLFEEVVRRCRRDGRLWFLDSDVDKAAARLEQDFRDGDETVWNYVRDVLNEADDRNNWAPGEGYPVALAWARALDDGLTGDEVVERVGQIVQSWSVGATILPDRLKEAIARLRDSKVLTRSDEFALPMLKLLLSVRARERDPFREECEKEALGRLGLRRVRRPQPKGAAIAGGQARWYPAEEDGQLLSVRCVPLLTEIARRNFMREVDLLDRLGRTTPMSTIADVGTYLPEVVRTGFAEDDPTLGVVIYKFVPGYELPEKGLSEEVVVLIGGCLAKVLVLLEDLTIVHRDIKRQNIIMRAKSHQPVLIDFGLAKDSSTESHFSGVVSQESPPEVVEHRQWSTAGDIYRLGRTLRECLEVVPDRGPLREILDGMVAHNPSVRPTPARLQHDFEALAESMKIDAHRAAFERSADALIEELPQRYRPAAKAARRDIVGCLWGSVSDQEQRCGTVAEFLEECFGALVASDARCAERFRSAAGQTKLIKAQELLTVDSPLRRFASPHATAVGYLRNASAHPADFSTNAERAYKALGKTRPAPNTRQKDRVLRSAIDSLVAQFDQHLQTGAFGKLVGTWLGR